MENDRVHTVRDIIDTKLPKWTIQERMKEMAKIQKDKPAIITFLNQETDTQINQPADSDIQWICFVADRFTVVRRLERQFMLLSRENVRVILDQTAYQIYSLFNGNLSVSEIYRQYVIGGKGTWSCETVDVESSVSIEKNINCHMEFSGLNGLVNFALFLRQHGFLVVHKVKVTADYPKYEFSEYDITESKVETDLSQIEPCKVLLLGDKPGMATVGILYLASYLVQNGISAKCLLINKEYSFQKFLDNLLFILNNMRPSYVAISMKWFPHIERVYEISRFVKQYQKDIHIIVGGDTASHYAREVIQEPTIDYVICGDGEDALLQICKGIVPAPNTYYKKNGDVHTPDSYITNSEKNVYSLLLPGKIMIDPKMLMYITLYLPTSKGCMHDCLQCGGTMHIQRKSMHRNPGLFTRPAHIVRQDIIQTQNHVASYMFSICDTVREDFSYFALMWKDLNLSNHVCALFSTSIIDEKIIDLAAKTFRYVRLGIDMCSLSERHREKINNHTNGKEQISDTMLYSFLDICERYDNCEVDIYTIAGMPFFEESDIQAENETIDKLLKYRCFRGIEWGRLHAQPGAKLLAGAEQYGLKADACDYTSFHQYSRLNQANSDIYPAMPYYHYPYISYVDSEKSRHVYGHYFEMSEKCRKNARTVNQTITKEISYYDLYALSCQMAKALLHAGLQSQQNVILYFNDRLYLSVAILSVILAGGCYIPLDPMFHENLIEHLASEDTVFKLFTDASISCNKRLDFCDLLHNSHSEMVLPEGNARLLLYRIYSSGSTDTPKCIAIRQESVTNYTNWRIVNYNISDRDVVLQMLSEAFDGFGSNFYTTLMAGGCLVMPTPKQNRDISFIKTICKKYQITHTSLLPFQLEMIVRNDVDVLKSFKSVVVAGETCHGDLLKNINHLYPALIVINEYGPTECSIAVTANIGLNEDSIYNIGRPISNVEASLVDAQGLPASNGEAGEIWITGCCLLSGYGFSDNTDSSDIPKVFKTNDTARYDINGDLIFMGRNERLVKIFGIMISLDMIEHVLRSHPYVSDAAVILQKNILCAYITLKHETDLKEVRQYLKGKIPSYSLPKLYYVIENIPRLLNGKVDYKNLIFADDNKASLKIEYDFYQEMISQLWADELGHCRFSLDDNFFDIGGNSLMIMKIYNKLNEQYPNVLSIMDFFTYHTVRTLAKHLNGCLKK